MPVYSDEVMEQYRQQGEMGFAQVKEDPNAKKVKGKKPKAAVDTGKRLPPMRT